MVINLKSCILDSIKIEEEYVMTRSEFMLQYRNWTKSIGLKMPPPIQEKRITLCICDLFESEDTLIGQIYYAVPVYTDKLHIFNYSMRTVWKKNSRGDTGGILEESYTI